MAATLESSAAAGVNGNQADNSAPDAGAVYVFTREGTAWSQQAYLKASNPDMRDQFGASISLFGTTLAISASKESGATKGVNGDQMSSALPESGAVYVLSRAGTTWSQTAYLKASNTDAFDLFGGYDSAPSNSISLSSNGLVIGAAGESSVATGVDGNQTSNGLLKSGAFYLFH